MDEIPDLWPGVIRSSVLPPIAIMRRQGSALAQRTQGILVGEIASTDDDVEIQHAFDIVAPALDAYTYRLFIVSHDMEMIYPANVQTPFEFSVKGSTCTSYKCSDPSTFTDVLREILTGEHAKAILVSLIARSNEVTTTPEEPGEES